MAMSVPAMTGSPRATGSQLRSALLTAASWLESQAERINALAFVVKIAPDVFAKKIR